MTSTSNAFAALAMEDEDDKDSKGKKNLKKKKSGTKRSKEAAKESKKANKKNKKKKEKEAKALALLSKKAASSPGFLGNLSCEQEAALAQMKSDSAAARAVGSDADLLRFLRARDFNVKNAVAMFEKQAKWREESCPADILLAPLEHLFDLGVYFYEGRDKGGRPVIWFRISQWNKKYSLLGTQATLYIMEHAFRHRLRAGEETVTFVLDLSGFSVLQADTMWTYRFAMALRDYYPERVGLILAANPPFYFSAFWRVVKGFIDPATLEKVVWLGKDYQKEIADTFIDKKYIPEYAGGSSNFDAKAWARQQVEEEEKAQKTGPSRAMDFAENDAAAVALVDDSKLAEEMEAAATAPGHASEFRADDGDDSNEDDDDDVVGGGEPTGSSV